MSELREQYEKETGARKPMTRTFEAYARYYEGLSIWLESKLKEAEEKIGAYEDTIRYANHKLKEAEKEKLILRVDNASYKGIIQAVKDSLMSDEEIEQDAKDGGLIGGEAQLYWEGATFQRERTKKAIGCS